MPERTQTLTPKQAQAPMPEQTLAPKQTLAQMTAHAQTQAPMPEQTRIRPRPRTHPQPRRQRALAAVAAAAMAAAMAIAATVAPAPAAYAENGSRAIKVYYQNLKITVDGRMIIPKDANGAQVHPFLYEDRTYVPIRALASALGFSVSWDAASSTARISRDGGGSPSYGAPAGKQSSETISVQYADISVSIDGKKAALDSEPFLYGGTTYLPLKDVAGALGCAVGYDHETRTISIAKPPAAAQAPGDAAGAVGQASGQTAGQTSGQSPSKTSAAPARSPSPSPAPSAPPASPSPAPAGSFSSADLAFLIAGKSVRLDENVSAALKLLGSGYSYQAAPSCAYTGEDKLYSYEGIDIATLPIGGDLICAIDVMSGDYKTSKSIGVGSPLSQIVAAYGADYTLDAGALTYWDGEKNNPKTPQLYFALDGKDAVTMFGMYNGKSAG
jgi:hypothetical protein